MSSKRKQLKSAGSKRHDNVPSSSWQEDGKNRDLTPIFDSAKRPAGNGRFFCASAL